VAVRSLLFNLFHDLLEDGMQLLLRDNATAMRRLFEAFYKTGMTVLYSAILFVDSGCGCRIRRKFRSESDVDRRRFANRKLGFLCFPGYQIEVGASSPSPSSQFNRLQALSSWRTLSN
jgi:hypothetical protein